jgi:hypothetical protein
MPPKLPTTSLRIPVPIAPAPPPDEGVGGNTVFCTSLAFRDHVHIDNDRDLVGVVTGFCFTSDDGHTVEVAWFHNGISYSAWFSPWRLHLVRA